MKPAGALVLIVLLACSGVLEPEPASENTVSSPTTPQSEPHSPSSQPEPFSAAAQEWEGVYQNVECGENATGSRTFCSSLLVEIRDRDGALWISFQSLENGEVLTHHQDWTARFSTEQAVFYRQACPDSPLREACPDAQQQSVRMLTLKRGAGDDDFSPVWGAVEAIGYQEPPVFFERL